MTQVVRIKSWEQMEKEYGLLFGSINCGATFTPQMKYLCNAIICIEDNRTTDKDRWNISDDMIAEYLDINDYPELLI